MAETMCDSGAVKLKAGSNVSSALTADNYTQLINQAESFINVWTKTNFTDNYAGLNVDVQKILEEAASCHAATGAINYDMSGFSSRQEALQMVNILWARMMESLRLLKDRKYLDFLEGA